MTERTGMTPEQQNLYDRIRRYSFGDEEAAFPFSARLARENGWSAGHAARAIDEYQKFAFLAVAAGHPVTPSDQVDQVWHLHLLYTRSYWNCFCREILRMRLHHGPTQGGETEREKFHDWYSRTLESYRRLFGTDPPADFWPESRIRFGEDIHHQRINTKRFWIVPKVALKKAGLAALLTLAFLLLVG